MNSNRHGAAGAVANGRLYVIGGTMWTGTYWQDVPTTSVYNPVTNSWTNLRPMPEPRSALGGARVVVNGQTRIQVIGGARPGNNLQYVP